MQFVIPPMFFSTLSEYISMCNKDATAADINFTYLFMNITFHFFILSVLSGQQDGDASGRSKQSRSEKKSRKAMLKLGMKPIPGVSRVTVKKSKNVGAFHLIHVVLLSIFVHFSAWCFV